MLFRNVIMKHKVYAFIDKQPHGLIDVFETRQKAKKCAHYVEKTGLKINGKLVTTETKIVLSCTN